MKQLILILCLALLLNIVYGSENHSHEHNTYEYNKYTTININAVGGVASSLAADSIDFDGNTLKWQMGAGIAEFDGQFGGAFGVSKRFDPHGPKVNVKFTTEEIDTINENGDKDKEIKTGISLGTVWTF